METNQPENTKKDKDAGVVVLIAFAITCLIVFCCSLPYKRNDTKPYHIIQGDTIYKPVIAR